MRRQGILIAVNSLDTESCCDFLTVYNGSSPASTRVGRYSGSRTPFQVLVSGAAEVLVVFGTDGSATGAGFTATFISVGIPSPTPSPAPAPMDPRCGATPQHRYASGSIAVGSYVDNLQCAWAVHASPGKRVRIRFSRLDVRTVWGACGGD